MTYYLRHSDWMKPNYVPEGMDLGMVNSHDRLDMLLKVELMNESPNKIVIDMGAGTGILGMYALDYGASFVYFVEQDPQMCYILENVLPKKLDPSKYKIISKDIENLTLEDFDRGTPAVVISELYGPTLFDEGYVSYTKHIKSLFNDIRFIPETFNVDFYLMDLNFRLPIWPNNKKLLEHYFFMYKEKGFSKQNLKVDYTNQTKVGSLYFNANTQKFINELIVNIPDNAPKLLISNATIGHGKFSQPHLTTFGWVVDKDNAGTQHMITVYEENYYNIRKIEINA